MRCLTSSTIFHRPYQSALWSSSTVIPTRVYIKAAEPGEAHEPGVTHED
jgi:hypothetical protein